VAVTVGPELSGSLLVGVNAARRFFAQDLPLVPVSHLESHLYANWILTDGDASPPAFPCLALIVSGGHTDLLVMEDNGRYRYLGHTRDDAAGEAFDKVARLWAGLRRAGDREGGGGSGSGACVCRGHGWQGLTTSVSAA
jgi:N6-L-threonylcarbamoyladenine synthase